MNNVYFTYQLALTIAMCCMIILFGNFLFGMVSLFSLALLLSANV